MSHNEAEETVQDTLAELNNDDPYCLDANEAKVLRAAGFNVRKGQWIVMHCDDYSQSHWIVDNIVYVGNYRKAQSIANEYAQYDY